MKKSLSKALSAACAAILAASVTVTASAEWENFRGSSDNNCVVYASVPTSGEDAALYWATKIGNDEWGADGPAPLTMSDTDIYCAGGDKLYRIDKETGKPSEKTGKLANYLSYNSVAPVYAEGMVFVAIDAGKIQAFDAETLESLWIYTDEIGGNTYTPITYSDGYIYTGFWKSETADANYVAIDVTDEDTTKGDEAKKAAWTYASKGGFYWAGAIATDDFIAFATEDGAGKENWYDPDVYTNDGKIVTLDKKTGQVIDVLSGIYGDIRSSLAYDEESDRYYFTAKSGLFCSVNIDADGKISDLKTLELGGASTSTPVIANGRAYVGILGENAYTPYSGSGIAVIDLDSFSVAYVAETRGYPQSSGLLSTDGEYNYVYFVENTAPSCIRFVKDKKGVTSVLDGDTEDVDGVSKVVAPTLFTPAGEQNVLGYSICSLICDDEGTLYFKNDDCYVMAVGAKTESIYAEGGKQLYREGESFDISDFTVTAELTNGEMRDITDKVSFSELPLSAEDIFVTLSYDYALYGDSAEGSGTKINPVTCTVDVNVLKADDYDKVMTIVELIDSIGEVTADSGEAISAAREAFDELDEELAEYVYNYYVLEDAEEEYDAILNGNYGNDDDDDYPTDDDFGETDDDDTLDDDSQITADDNFSEIDDTFDGNNDLDVLIPDGDSVGKNNVTNVLGSTTANPNTGKTFGGLTAAAAALLVTIAAKKKK